MFLSFSTEILYSAGADVGRARDRNAGKCANLLEQHVGRDLVHSGKLDSGFAKHRSSIGDLSGNRNAAKDAKRGSHRASINWNAI